MSEGECRFVVLNGTEPEPACDAHENASPALCSHAADALRARLVDAQDKIAVWAAEEKALRAKVAELEGKECGDILYHALARRLIERIINAADMSLPDAGDIELSLARIIGERNRAQSLLATRDAQVAALREALVNLTLAVGDDVGCAKLTVKCTCGKAAQLTAAHQQAAYFVRDAALVPRAGEEE